MQKSFVLVFCLMAVFTLSFGFGAHAGVESPYIMTAEACDLETGFCATGTGWIMPEHANCSDFFCISSDGSCYMPDTSGIVDMDNAEPCHKAQPQLLAGLTARKS